MLTPTAKSHIEIPNINSNFIGATLFWQSMGVEYLYSVSIGERQFQSNGMALGK